MRPRTDGFEPGAVHPGPPDPHAWCFALRDGRLALGPGDGIPTLAAVEAAGAGAGPALFLGRLDGRPCVAVALAAEPPPPLATVGLRELHGRLPEPVYGVAGRAAQVLTWDRDHAFCGRCGGPTAPAATERARRCPACGLAAYPRVSPCVITLVERGDEILLARGRGFRGSWYSLLAGFVEAGETLEEAVVREVHEETGVLVDDVRYRSSQPWPFPHQLMLGFRARWVAGDLAVDEAELVTAGWFRRGALPELPPGLSVARRMIDDWAAEG